MASSHVPTIKHIPVCNPIRHLMNRSKSYDLCACRVGRRRAVLAWKGGAQLLAQSREVLRDKALPASTVSMLTNRKLLENSRVESVRGGVVGDKVVCELVASRDPPVPQSSGCPTLLDLGQV